MLHVAGANARALPDSEREADELSLTSRHEPALLVLPGVSTLGCVDLCMRLVLND